MYAQRHWYQRPKYPDKDGACCMGRGYAKSRPTPQSITVAAHCTVKSTEKMHSAWQGTVNSSRLCVPSRWAILNWVRFGKYEHGLRALGQPSFALIELGSFWQTYAALFWQPSLQAFPFLPSIFRFPDPSIKGYGTLVGVW